MLLMASFLFQNNKSKQ